MTMNLFLFLVLAGVAIATALGMLLNKNAIYSALFLILNFVTIAIFYLLLGAPFLAMTQVTVYAGAIMVLFLFVIMLLGTDDLPENEKSPNQKPFAIGLAAILLVESLYLVFIQKTAPGLINSDPDAIFGGPQAIGEMLFNKYLLPFEMTSILLLVAMIGAIVLTVKKKGGQS